MLSAPGCVVRKNPRASSCSTPGPMSGSPSSTRTFSRLREQGHAAPKSTPQSPKSYARLESVFLGLCDEKAEPAAFDLAIWSSRAK